MPSALASTPSGILQQGSSRSAFPCKTRGSRGRPFVRPKRAATLGNQSGDVCRRRRIGAKDGPIAALAIALMSQPPVRFVSEANERSAFQFDRVRPVSIRGVLNERGEIGARWDARGKSCNNWNRQMHCASRGRMERARRPVVQADGPATNLSCVRVATANKFRRMTFTTLAYQFASLPRRQHATRYPDTNPTLMH
jgi:hypothetical protein